MSNWNIKNISEPALEPVTLAELKLQSRISYNNEDTLLSTYIKTARIFAENYQRLSYITQTKEITIDGIPPKSIYLIHGPVQSLTSVTIYDLNGDFHTVDNSNFILDNSGDLCRLHLTDSGEWPNITLQAIASLKIRYVAGYGLTGASVPENIKHAIILFASFMEDNRASDTDKIPSAFYSLLRPGRININAPW